MSEQRTSCVRCGGPLDGPKSYRLGCCSECRTKACGTLAYRTLSTWGTEMAGRKPLDLNPFDSRSWEAMDDIDDQAEGD